MKHHPRVFECLCGVSGEEFEEIIVKVIPEWEKKVVGRYQRPGRDYKLELRDRVLMVFLYYRSDVTPMFIGYWFGLDDSRVCRIIRKLEPFLAYVIVLKKERHLPKEEVESMDHRCDRATDRASQVWSKTLLFGEEETPYFQDRDPDNAQGRDHACIESKPRIRS